MAKIYTIIIVVSSKCPYCILFKPIYENTIKLLENNKEYKFELYDIINNSASINFETNYPNLSKKLNGVPSVFLYYDDNNKKNNLEINPTHIDNDSTDNKDKLLNDAVDTFIENIKNGFKTMLSDSKLIYTKSNQNGGSIEYYLKMKYIKYKNKYLKLKQKIIE